MKMGLQLHDGGEGVLVICQERANREGMNSSLVAQKILKPKEFSVSKFGNGYD